MGLFTHTPGSKSLGAQCQNSQALRAQCGLEGHMYVNRSLCPELLRRKLATEHRWRTQP